MGTLWNRSGTIERYGDDLRAAGAKAYFYLGNSTTPLAVYQDAGEASAHAIPLVADASGRWPAVFIPYIASYDVKVTDAYDVQLTYYQAIPNPDPVDVTVVIPAEEKVQTGMIHAEFDEAVKAGYVRLNGLTIGNAASAGTERANADTENLFAYLWNKLSDTLAPVSGGRGASAAADFAANKRITLPDCRGRVMTGVDDMGAAGGLTYAGLTFSLGDANTPGSRLGANGITLAENQLPEHRHYMARGAPAAGGLNAMASNVAVITDSNTATTEATLVGGSGALVNNMNRSMLVCWYIKL